MKKSWIFWLPVVVLILVVFGFEWGTGIYTFTPKGALRQLPVADKKDMQVMDELNYGWCDVFLLETPSGYHTSVVEKDGVLWHLSVTWNLPKTSAPVQTIGWASLTGQNHNLAVLAVKTNDPAVTSIEAGPITDRKKQQIAPEKPAILTWQNAITLMGSDSKPVALSSQGTELYYYGYPKNTTTFRTSDLKWYPSS